MAEKVTLTPDGLLVSQWNSNTREYEVELMGEDENVLSHLRTYCEIDNDTTLWHIMDFVRKNELLCLFLAPYSWCNNIDDYHAELDKKPVIDENDNMDHMEIYWHVMYHKSRKDTDFGMSASFHGVGLPITKENQKEKNKDSFRGELPLGFIEKYSTSGLSIERMSHLKVMLDTEIKVYRLKRSSPAKSVCILTSKCSFSLLDVLNAIYDDISFFGAPEQRDEWVGDMHNQIEKSREDIAEGNVSTIDEVFENLGIEPDTEEDKIADDEIDTSEWEIEE